MRAGARIDYAAGLISTVYFTLPPEDSPRWTGG